MNIVVDAVEAGAQYFGGKGSGKQSGGPFAAPPQKMEGGFSRSVSQNPLRSVVPAVKIPPVAWSIGKAPATTSIARSQHLPYVAGSFPMRLLLGGQYGHPLPDLPGGEAGRQ